MKIKGLVVSTALASAVFAAAATASATTYTSVQDIGGETVDLSITTDGKIGSLFIPNIATPPDDPSDITAFSISGSGPLGSFDATSTLESYKVGSYFAPTYYYYSTSSASGATSASFSGVGLGFLSIMASSSALNLQVPAPYYVFYFSVPPGPPEVFYEPNTLTTSLNISVYYPTGSYDFCAGDFCGTSAIGQSLSYTSSQGASSTLTLSYPLDTTSITLGTVSAAPEPSSWLLMIAGVGLVGSVLRRRGRLAPLAIPTRAQA